MNEQLYCATFITKPACQDEKTLRPLKRERERERETEGRNWRETWTNNERERDKERERERERERETVWEKDLQTETRSQFFSTSGVGFRLDQSMRVNKFPLMKAKTETLGEKTFFFVSVCPYTLPLKLQRQANENERDREIDR